MGWVCSLLFWILEEKFGGLPGGGCGTGGARSKPLHIGVGVGASGSPRLDFVMICIGINAPKLQFHFLCLLIESGSLWPVALGLLKTVKCPHSLDREFKQDGQLCHLASESCTLQLGWRVGSSGGWEGGEVPKPNPPGFSSPASPCPCDLEQVTSPPQSPSFLMAEPGPLLALKELRF